MFCFFSSGQSKGSVENVARDCFIVTEEMPLFDGCNIDSLSYGERINCSHERLINFFIENYKWQRDQLHHCYSGRVVVRWKINKDGSISDIEFLRSYFPLIEKEVKRVIDIMPCWEPGKKEGVPVDVCFTFPIRIELR